MGADAVPAPPGGTGDGSSLTVLGSGTLFPHAQRASPSVLLEVPGAKVLLDCGPGTVHGLARLGVAWQELTHVAVSHYHLDHVGDLSALVFALGHAVHPPRQRPLVLVGPRGFGLFVERLAGALGSHLVDPGFDVDVVELGAGDAMDVPGARLRISAHPTPHTRDSVAYRLDMPGLAVGYTGDTGPSREVAAFLSGCRVLVMECTQDDPPALATHLSPATAASMAADASPGLLVVTHVAPPLQPEEAVSRISAAGFPGAVVAGFDGLRVELASPPVDPAAALS